MLWWGCTLVDCGADRYNLKLKEQLCEDGAAVEVERGKVNVAVSAVSKHVEELVEFISSIQIAHCSLGILCLVPSDSIKSLLSLSRVVLQ